MARLAAARRLGSPAHNRPGRPQDVARICVQRALGLKHAQSACRGMARGSSSAAKPRQDVHHKLPKPTVHSPSSIESPSSQRGKWAMEGRNSPARSTALELNGGEGAGPSGLGAALGPTYGERGGVRWLGNDEVEENRGEA
jgi:hypothetical protein